MIQNQDKIDPVTSTSDSRPPSQSRIDIGLVTTLDPYSIPNGILNKIAQRLNEELSLWLTELDWRITVQEHALRAAPTSRGDDVEPIDLLLKAAELRDQYAWDFVLVVTSASLVSRYRRYSIAALSRPLDASIISLARLQDRTRVASDTSIDSDNLAIAKQIPSEPVLVDRITTLMLHALGHLGGLPSRSDTTLFLHNPVHPEELDGMGTFTPAELRTLMATFMAVADTRLEEENPDYSMSWRFSVKAAIINRKEILDAVLAARAWEFPRHLSRLTTAAVSTLAILLLTAEVWDIALSQPWYVIAILALLSLTLTTTFVANKQQLLLRRNRLSSEQLVVTRVSAMLTVIVGLSTTWIGAFMLSMLGAITLFDPVLVAGWASNSGADLGGGLLVPKIAMSAFCASVALLIGALGASFEDQHHFQHVIYVDEEL